MTWPSASRMPATKTVHQPRYFGSSDTISAGGFSGTSVNLRLRHGQMRGEKIEIAALVGLPDMGREHRPIAALVARWRRCPRRLAPRHLFIGDRQIDAARADVDLDRIARLHEGER